MTMLSILRAVHIRPSYDTVVREAIDSVRDVLDRAPAVLAPGLVVATLGAHLEDLGEDEQIDAAYAVLNATAVSVEVRNAVIDELLTSPDLPEDVVQPVLW